MKKNGLFNPARFPFFYGYVVVLVGTIGVWASLPGQTVGVSTFTDPVKDALGLSRDQFSTTYMIGTMLSSFLSALQGAGSINTVHDWWLQDRHWHWP